MSWEIASAQSIGGRGNQEDAFAVLGQGNGKPRLLAVADGAGGHADGEKASRAAIDRLSKAFAEAPHDVSAARQWMTRSFAEADRDIAALGEGQMAPRTTLVLAWIGDKQALAGHIGDSRLYHFRDGKLAFRSRDHSVVQLLLDMGRLKESEVSDHPDRSRLTKALGGGDGAEPEMTELALARGDGLALCSDGVWEHVETGEIEIALRAPALDRAADELVRLAVERGGKGADNATLVLARLR
jgi:serine/threonine protein phosphatase PrpC